MQRKTGILTAFGVTLALLIVLSVVLSPAGYQPTALAAPTPVSFTASGGGTPKDLTFYDEAVLTADSTGAAASVWDHDRMDLQYVVDQGASTNGITLTVQYSNDGENWVDGATYAAGTTDKNVMEQYHLFGRYARVEAAVTNTNPVTVSVFALAK